MGGAGFVDVGIETARPGVKHGRVGISHHSDEAGSGELKSEVRAVAIKAFRSALQTIINTSPV